MKLGVCYYPEQWPESRWRIDARMMVEAGLEMVRIAEFAWARMEPSPGQHDWTWLDQAIEILARSGLKVILGTPTATPPSWLTQTHPDVLRVDANGRRRGHGSRRHACVNNLVYRVYSEQIVRALGERYGRDRRVIGWQIDNEFGGGKTARCYCEACAAAFRQWLETRYGTLGALNAAWGTVFWSQTYFDWGVIRLPDEAIDKANPSQALDFYRFSSDSYVAYQQSQIDILRPLTDGFMTHNFMGLYRDLNQFDLARPLDFVSWDNYPTGNPDRWRQLLYPPGRNAGRTDPVYAYDVGDPIITSMAHALTRGLKQRPFWIMEQQCGFINWGEVNPGIRPGTARLWTWHALAEGADACLYFRWRPTLFGQEQYHSGLLRHDAEPAQGLKDVVALRSERALMAAIAVEPCRADVAILIDYDDLWAIELHPQRRDFNYLRHLFVYYEALLRLGIAVDIIPHSTDLSGYRLVLAPTLHMPDAPLVERLTEYVAGGGMLLLGVRSGLKTPSNLVTDQPLPGALRALAGITITSWQALPDGTGLAVTTDVPNLNGNATYWYEALQPHSARLLGVYETGEGAVAVNDVGRGHCITLGWYPTPAQASALMGHLATSAGVERIASLPPGLLAARRGTRVLLLNFTDKELEAVVQGASVSVPARDIRTVAI